MSFTGVAQQSDIENARGQVIEDSALEARLKQLKIGFYIVMLWYIIDIIVFFFY